MEKLERKEEYINYVVSGGSLKAEDIIQSVMEFWEYESLLNHEAVSSVYQELKELLKLKELIKDVVDNCECLVLKPYEDKLKEIDNKLEIIVQEDIYSVNNTIAPVGTFFGMHQGDGTLLGFWETEETSKTIYLKNDRMVKPLGSVDSQRLQEVGEEICSLINGAFKGFYHSHTNVGYMGVSADYDLDKISKEQEEEIYEIVDKYRYEMVGD